MQLIASVHFSFSSKLHTLGKNRAVHASAYGHIDMVPCTIEYRDHPTPVTISMIVAMDPLSLHPWLLILTIHHLSVYPLSMVTAMDHPTHVAMSMGMVIDHLSLCKFHGYCYGSPVNVCLLSFCCW